MRITRHRLATDEGSRVPYERSPNTGGALNPRWLVMHYTAGRSAAESVGWLTRSEARASAHLVIGRDGAVTQLVPFDRVAWHAGRSTWQGVTGLNGHSIGIELDNAGRLQRQGGGWRAWFGKTYGDDQVMEAVHRHETGPAGWHVFTEAQLEASLEVARALIDKYELEGVLGHDDISPGRKVDPGPAFPMGSFRARLMGREHDTPPRYRVTTGLNIRTGPGTQNDRLPQAPLAQGTVVEPVRTVGTWWLVDVMDHPDGDVQGWVHARYLQRVAA